MRLLLTFLALFAFANGAIEPMDLLTSCFMTSNGKGAVVESSECGNCGSRQSCYEPYRPSKDSPQPRKKCVTVDTTRCTIDGLTLVPGPWSGGVKPGPMPVPRPKPEPRPTLRPQPRQSPGPGPGPSPPITNNCKDDKDEGRSGTGCRWRIKYYYTGSKCSYFLYKGCGGNGNLYDSRTDCQKACEGETRPHLAPTPSPSGKDCTSSPDPGWSGSSCQPGYRYYFKMSEQMCSYFRYEGCGGNGNNYPSWTYCKNNCGKGSWPRLIVDPFGGSSSSSSCRLSKKLGDTSCGLRGGYRFYYDHSMQKCTLFHFKGCNGNQNNFKTRSDCNSKCP